MNLSSSINSAASNHAFENDGMEVDKKLENSFDKQKSIIRIQSIVRRFVSLRRVRRRTVRLWDRVFDARFKMYFWYNKGTGESQWTVPRLMRLHDERDHAAAICMQKIVRGFNGRMRARKKAYTKYTRFFDSNKNRFYWMINSTKQTFWDASSWLKKQNIPLTPEDEMLYKSYLRIQELEAKLAQKELEIKQVRQKRYEELEPEILHDKVKNAKDLVRSKHMDFWSIDQLAAWFTELKMDDYIPFIYQNRVDGNLFVNLNDAEYQDMGITNKFHLRKLQIIMKAYRARYQKKKATKQLEDDDELLSEYSPSELSGIIAHEGLEDDNNENEEELEEEDYQEEEIVLTEEEKLEREEEERNVSVHILVKGDEENFPMVGDIVRVRYTCSLTNGKIVSSTKAGMQMSAIEFVLGVNQVIKGFDCAIPQMSVGERSKIKISAEYAYGKPGLFPIIPPDADLVFDLTLLGFRARAEWIKPLIQQPGLSEKPYVNTDGESPFTLSLRAEETVS